MAAKKKSLSDQLAGTSFAPIDKDVKARVVISIEGKEKTGKSHFAYSAPGPIILMNTDRGHEGVVNKFPDKEVWESQYDFHPPKKARQDPAAAITWMNERWEKFCDDYAVALKASGARTIILDNWSDAFEACRIARFGKLTQVLPEHYGPVNVEFTDLMRKAYDHDANVIFLHRIKEEWADRKPLGTYKREGFKNVGSIVQLVMRSERVDLEKGGSDFVMRVLDSRHNPDLNGETFENATFQDVAMRLMPDSDESDWE